MASQSQKLFTEGAGLCQSKNGNPIARKVALGVAGLMLETSGRDGDYAPEELDIIRQALQKHLQIAPEQLQTFLQEADELRKQNIELTARSIREAFTQDQLVIVLAMVWQVVLADNKVGTVERHFADSIRARLALPAEQSKEAEKIAKSAIPRKK